MPVLIHGAGESPDVMKRSGGEFTGVVKALSPTGDGAGGVRNIYVLDEQKPGAELGRDGDICIVLPGGA